MIIEEIKILANQEPQQDITQWDDTKLRHAYWPNQHEVALCGYDGPSTWRGEKVVPPNVCPICHALRNDYLQQVKSDEN
jgi:hypothetical protein